MRRVFAFHLCSHSQLLKEQVPATQIDVATEVSKKFFRQQERCSSRYYIHTQYSIDSCNSNSESCQSPGFQCLIVAKTEGHGLSKLDPLRTQVPFFASISSHLSRVFCPIRKREHLVSVTPLPMLSDVLWPHPKWTKNGVFASLPFCHL